MKRDWINNSCMWAYQEWRLYVYTLTPPNKSHFRLHVPSLERFQYSKHKLVLSTTSCWPSQIEPNSFFGEPVQRILKWLNVQSPANHSPDVSTDPVLPSTDILALTETWTDKDETVSVDGYKCITQFKRQDVRSDHIRKKYRLTFSRSWINKHGKDIV
jgi:hypothetical protein